MLEGRITNRSVASGAWGDSLAALNRMRGPAALAVLGLVLLTSLPLIWNHGSPVGFRPGQDSARILAWNGLMLTLFALGESLLLAPIAIAVHRFILLGEAPGTYRFDWAVPRFRRFVAYACLLDLAWSLPVGLMAALQLVSTPLSVLAGLLGFLATAILSVRLALLFPAVAIDAPDAGWQGALALSRDRGWTIFLALLLTELVGMLIVAVASPLKTWGFELALNDHLMSGALLVGSVEAVTTLVTGAALVAAASRLYRNLHAAAEPDAEAVPG